MRDYNKNQPQSGSGGVHAKVFIFVTNSERRTDERKKERERVTDGMTKKRHVHHPWRWIYRRSDAEGDREMRKQKAREEIKKRRQKNMVTPQLRRKDHHLRR